MLLGIGDCICNCSTVHLTSFAGSPGTLARVVYGYFGDRQYDPKWTVRQLKDFASGSFPFVEPELFDRLGSGYLRPFELATVRLQVRLVAVDAS
eukprot:750094-Hanusia_phi.AAC.3